MTALEDQARDSSLDAIAVALAKRILARDQEMFNIPLNDWDDLHPKSVEMRTALARMTLDDLVDMGVMAADRVYGVATDLDDDGRRTDVIMTVDARQAYSVARRTDDIRDNAGMRPRATRVYTRRQTEWVEDEMGTVR